ncbi:MAG: hypothetical protein K2O73_04960 [Lachnospiraceae bacterium]|nr:hypothetical protein [Lachnospiraceae bacterium]
MDKTKILGLGIYGTDALEDIIDIDDFSGQTSLLDYTSAIISVEDIAHEYMRLPGKFQGLTCLHNDDSSARLVSDMVRRKDEVVELLKQGNNIFVILPSEQYLYVRTGKKEYSGTGQNRSVTNIVSTYDLLSFLPVEIETVKAAGQNIRYVGDERFHIIKDDMLDDLRYRSYLSKGEGKPLLQIANTSKSVGMVIEYLNGKIILLPEIADEDVYDSESEWEAAFGKCIRGLIALDGELRDGTDGFQLPEWTEDFLIPTERAELEGLHKYQEQLEEIKDKIRAQELVIKELQKLKLAFSSTGENLEKICKEIFLKLGFTELPSEHNRSDLVLQYEKKDVVVEIKGLSKSAGEKNAAQLEKWVSEHIEKYEKQPKAILLVNAFRNVRLDERAEAVFPSQMLKYASNREQCLLSTTQFLGLYLDCMNHPEQKKDNIDKLLHTVGEYKEYMNFADFIEKV